MTELEPHKVGALGLDHPVVLNNTITQTQSNFLHLLPLFICFCYPESIACGFEGYRYHLQMSQSSGFR